MTTRTGILLMNMGGPKTVGEVKPFLQRLFSDSDLLQLPVQRYMSRFIAWRRSPEIRKQYEAVGGGSPILHWTQSQGKLLVDQLDKLHPETAPHRFYVGFRYAEPLMQDAVQEMLQDGITNAIAFSQYPQYSCSTTGSSLNELHRLCQSLDPEESIKWRLIDRWPTHSKLVAAHAKLIEETIAKEYRKNDDNPPVLLFSAHSLPLSVVNRGDPYPHEVAATVSEIMRKLGNKYSYRLVWQSKVGPAEWLGPQTDEAIKGLVSKGKRNILIVPVAFTSDHIETLYELDLEYVKHAKEELGADGVKRLPALNVEPLFIESLTDLALSCLKEPESSPLTQLSLRCPGCINPRCEQTKAFFHRHHNTCSFHKKISSSDNQHQRQHHQ